MAAAGTVLLVDDGVGLWGAQRYLLRMRGVLREEGHRSVLVTPAASELGRVWRDDGGGAWRRLPEAIYIEEGRGRGRAASSALLHYLPRTLRRALVLAQLAEAEGAGLIVGNSSFTHLESALGGLLAGVPVLLHLHEEVSGRARWGRAVAVALSTSSVAVSEGVRAALPRRASRCTRVVRNGVDVDAFRPGAADPRLRAELAEDPMSAIVAYLGRLDQAKQVDHLIDAVAGLATSRNVSLVMVGASAEDPGYEQELRGLAQSRLGARGRVLPERDDVAEVLRSVDIVVFPGRQEGLSLGLLEALSCGRPVVAYSAAGVNEVVETGRTGLVVPMGEERALSEAIRRLVDDPPEADRLAQAAAAYAQRSLGLPDQLQGNAEAVSEAMSHPGSRLSRAVIGPAARFVLAHAGWAER